MNDTFDYQVKSLVSMVQRLHKTGGMDRALEARVRTFVSGELLGGGLPDVTARALGELDDAEADRLHVLVNHCSQTFYRTDSIWSAFAIPVAVNWHLRDHQIYIAKRGGREYLDELASGIRQCVGAEAIFLDNHIYSAKELFMADARKLHDHLQHLVIGSPRGTAVLKSMALRSASEPPWRVVYFLGVEVLNVKTSRRLNDPGVQEALQSYLHLGADALTMPKSPMFDKAARGETHCLSPRYLYDAIHDGRKAMRGFRLRQILEEISKEEKRATLHYALSPMWDSVNLLLSGRWLTFEMRWELTRAEVKEDFFHDAFAITSRVKNIECPIQELEFEDFQAARSTSNLVDFWKT